MFHSIGQGRKCVSYGAHEKGKLFGMERFLMDHYGYDYSRLHKSLIREKYERIQDALKGTI